MIAMPLAKIPEFVEYVVEWSDGKEMFCEDFLQAGRAVRYRHRMLGFHAFLITAWRSCGRKWEVLWDMEWTEADMLLTASDFEGLRKQRVPLRLLDQLFSHPGLGAELFVEGDEDRMEPYEPRNSRKTRNQFESSGMKPTT